MTIEDISALVTVSIHAGSSGKPDTTQQRQAWTQVMPIIQGAIKEIGQLRGSSPDEIADCMEALIVETINRTGDRVDSSTFLPDPPRTPPPPPLPPPAPPLELSALSGPQVAAMTAVLADVRAGVLTGPSAIALLGAAFPHVPLSMAQAMVNGSLPQPGDGPTNINAPHGVAAPPAPPLSVPGQPGPLPGDPPTPMDTHPLPAMPHMAPLPMNPGDMPHVNA
jgi:hypothetical protein